MTANNNEYEKRINELENEVAELKKQLKSAEIHSSDNEIYFHFFNSLKDFFWILDHQGNILFVNDYVIERLHYTREELYKMNVIFVHPPERQQEAIQTVGEMLCGISDCCPIPILTKEGWYIPVETRIVKGVWKNKDVIFGISKDISELKLSEEKFSKAFELNTNSVAISELETGKYLDVNQKFLDTFNLRKEDVIGKTSLEINIFDAQTRQKIIAEFKKQERLENYEIEIEFQGKKVYGLFSANRFYLQEKKCWITCFQDITPIVEVQKELQESKNIAQFLFENIDAGLLIIDPATRIIERINNTALQIIEQQKDNVIGKKCHNFFCPANENCCPILDNLSTVDLSERIAINIDNKTIPILKSVKRIILNGQEKLFETFIDISERKKLEEQLKENEEKFRVLFETVATGITLADANGQIITSNKAAIRILGLSVEDHQQRLIDGTDWKIIRPDGTLMPPEEYASVRALKEQKAIYHVEMGVTKAKDNIVWIIVNAAPIVNKGVVISYEDITERKKAEIALKTSEARWKFALEGAKDGVWDWNIATSEVYFSPQWKTMLGFEEHEITASLDEWSKRVHPEDLAKCYAEIQLHLDGKNPFYSNIHRVLCKDGSFKWILDRGKISEFDVNGKPIKMIGTHTDLTDMVEMEKQLIQLNADKDRFMSIIAHDLRSPFNAILGFSELVLKNFAQNDFSKIEKYLTLLNKSASKAYDLLNNLLDWARSQTGRIKFNPEKCNLYNIVVENIFYVDEIARKKFIDISFNIQKNFHVWCDKNMIDTILRNLITNAIKFTQTGGKIRIIAVKIENFIIVTVKDNGIGIKPDTLKKLFDITQKVSTEGTNKETGTGLGLLLCKEFIEKHNCKIWVESEEGKGSNFMFTLPLCNNVFA